MLSVPLRSRPTGEPRPALYRHSTSLGVSTPAPALPRPASLVVLSTGRSALATPAPAPRRDYDPSLARALASLEAPGDRVLRVLHGRRLFGGGGSALGSALGSAGGSAGAGAAALPCRRDSPRARSRPPERAARLSRCRSSAAGLAESSVAATTAVPPLRRSPAADSARAKNRRSAAGDGSDDGRRVQRAESDGGRPLGGSGVLSSSGDGSTRQGGGRASSTDEVVKGGPTERTLPPLSAATTAGKPPAAGGKTDSGGGGLKSVSPTARPSDEREAARNGTDSAGRQRFDDGNASTMADPVPATTQRTQAAAKSDGGEPAPAERVRSKGSPEACGRPTEPREQVPISAVGSSAPGHAASGGGGGEVETGAAAIATFGRGGSADASLRLGVKYHPIKTGAVKTSGHASYSDGEKLMGNMANVEVVIQKGIGTKGKTDKVPRNTVMKKSTNDESSYRGSHSNTEAYREALQPAGNTTQPPLRTGEIREGKQREKTKTDARHQNANAPSTTTDMKDDCFSKTPHTENDQSGAPSKEQTVVEQTVARIGHLQLQKDLTPALDVGGLGPSDDINNNVCVKKIPGKANLPTVSGMTSARTSGQKRLENESRPNAPSVTVPETEASTPAVVSSKVPAPQPAATLTRPDPRTVAVLGPEIRSPTRTETPTGVTTGTPTIVTTGTPTIVTTGTSTAVTTGTPAVPVTGAPTPLGTWTPTAVTTGTLTIVTTGTTTVVGTGTSKVPATETSKALGTRTPTVVTTGTPTLSAKATLKVVTSGTPKVVATETPTIPAQETPTLLATGTPSSGITRTPTTPDSEAASVERSPGTGLASDGRPPPGAANPPDPRGLEAGVHPTRGQPSWAHETKRSAPQIASQAEMASGAEKRQKETKRRHGKGNTPEPKPTDVLDGPVLRACQAMDASNSARVHSRHPQPTPRMQTSDTQKDEELLKPAPVIRDHVLRPSETKEVLGLGCTSARTPEGFVRSNEMNKTGDSRNGCRNSPQNTSAVTGAPKNTYTSNGVLGSSEANHQLFTASSGHLPEESLIMGHRKNVKSDKKEAEGKSERKDVCKAPKTPAAVQNGNASSFGCRGIHRKVTTGTGQLFSKTTPNSEAPVLKRVKMVRKNMDPAAEIKQTKLTIRNNKTHTATIRDVSRLSPFLQADIERKNAQNVKSPENSSQLPADSYGGKKPQSSIDNNDASQAAKVVKKSAAKGAKLKKSSQCRDELSVQDKCTKRSAMKDRVDKTMVSAATANPVASKAKSMRTSKSATKKRSTRQDDQNIAIESGSWTASERESSTEEDSEEEVSPLELAKRRIREEKEREEARKIERFRRRGQKAKLKMERLRMEDDPMTYMKNPANHKFAFMMKQEDLLRKQQQENEKNGGDPQDKIRSAEGPPPPRPDELDDAPFDQRCGPLGGPPPKFRLYGADDFHMLRVLGKGAFGKVMLARMKGTKNYFAVKCLRKDKIIDEEDVADTLTERKILALGTNHPYLCHLFCTFQTPTHLFFVLEFLNGGDLNFHLAQMGRFSTELTRFYASELVCGLRFLHKRGIIYRDLKLDNVLLDHQGHVRIADFGMCKMQIFLDRTADAFCGTVDYMAPEVVCGKSYNQSVDWWSFGIMLYEMVVGLTPFIGLDEDELFWAIRTEEPYYPRFLDDDAAEIIKWLLVKEPALRLGSAECPAGGICSQTFFRRVDWIAVERKQVDPPFKPVLRTMADCRYFEDHYTTLPARLTMTSADALRQIQQDRFSGFDYTNPNMTD